MKRILWGLVLLLIGVSSSTALPSIAGAPLGVPQVGAVSEAVSDEAPPVSLLFVGDIMLGRAVEGLMERYGAGYPFRQTRQLLAFPDVTVGNFEGIVAEEHVRTPSMGFQFSVRNEYLTELREVGFDVLSLANNHSFDHGETALEHTKRLCRAIRLSCGGLPGALGDDSFTVVEVSGEQVGFVFLSTVWGDVDEGALDELLARARAESTFLVAYVHWGDEYELTHNEAQEKLAHALISGGVDAVIGHHPHVVQDVALYRGKPIFYSLGNFIFDQYFSDEVTEGLGVGITLTKDEVRYRLIPFRNDIAESQPHTVGASDRNRLLGRVLEGMRSEPEVTLSDGVIVFSREP